MSSRILRISAWTLVIICLVSGGVVASGLAFVLSGMKGDARFPADCAIVFGAAVHPVFDDYGKLVSSTPGPGIARRVKTAVDLYKHQQVSRLYMSGGKGDGSKFSEAFVMKQLALELGVDGKDIVTETGSRSTEENIWLTRPLTGSCSSVIGVSDDYHLARIEWIAKTQGWKLSTVPTQGKANAIFEAKSVIREIGALVMFTLKNLFT